MKYTDLSCIRCGKKFDSDGWDSMAPYGSLLFIARGNYGSTVYDPMADEYLLVIICDDCVMAEQEKRNVMRVVPVRKTAEDIREPWEGPGGDHPEG